MTNEHNPPAIAFDVPRMFLLYYIAPSWCQIKPVEVGMASGYDWVILFLRLAMELLLSITLFTLLGAGFVMANLLLGKLFRPRLSTPDKRAIYECGEPTIGSGWVQFDLRFYIVALFYLVFDVEVALIYPWAIVFRQIPLEALVLGLPFLGIIIIGYAYEWHSGSLEWVRSSINTSLKAQPSASPARPGVPVEQGG